MTAEIKNSIIDCGYAFLRKIYLDLNTSEVASILGKPMVPWVGGLVQNLTPRAESTPNTYSGIYGLGHFPFHTDLAHWRRPPRYLLLRCIRGYEDVKTLLIDGRVILSAVTLDVMTRAIMKPRRPQNNAIHLLRLCEQVESGYRLRWDEKFLRPASRIGEAASKQIRSVLCNTSTLSAALIEVGDMLIIDNWRMLHARTPVQVGREDRLIQRVYLEELY